MGYDLWNHSKFLHHKVRNMTRRGWLLKTYNDGKLLKARVKTGEKIENDDIDILHPVGMVAHVEPSEKTEIFTMDVGGDTSRRVVSQIIGDREQHPQPDENEVYFYAPGEKKMFVRFKKKRSQQQQSRSNGGSESQGRTQESGRVTGMHWDGLEEKVSGQNKETFQNKADKGQGYKTDGNFDIKAANATQFEAGKHTRKGTTYRDGDTFTQGSEHATDHVAGGGAVVGSLPMARVSRAAGTLGLPENTPDGSQAVQAQGIPGSISLKGMAAAMGMASVDSGGGGQPSGGGMMQQMKDDKAELLKRIEALEKRVTYLETFHPPGP